jgi:hypothetical protein
MVRLRRLAVAALVIAAGVVCAPTARAGPLWNWLHGCPQPDYSPVRYWAPAVARAHDEIHGPKISVYPPDRHPEIPPTFEVLPYRCPPVAPALTIIDVPTPPPESRAR